MPVGGLPLVLEMFWRLDLCADFWASWVCRTFAHVVEAHVPRLTPYLRAEKFSDGTLHLIVVSSAVASDLSFARDTLIEETNASLRLHFDQTAPKYRKLLRPVLRLEVRTAKLSSIPSAPKWQQHQEVPGLPPPPPPSIQTKLAVVQASQEVSDPELRRLLLRLVGALPSPNGPR